MHFRELGGNDKPFYHQASLERYGTIVPDGERRLAAIMYTDMVGHTALGQRNESLSLALVEEQRKLIRPILSRYTVGKFNVPVPSCLYPFLPSAD